MSLKHLKENYYNLQIAGNCYFPLALAVTIYLLFRSKSHLFLTSIHLNTASYLVKDVQSSFYYVKQFVPSWFIYSLPDGLWTYSMICLYILSSRRDTNKLNRFMFICLAPIISLSIEIAQYYHIFPGTFDVVDICFICIASILAYISMFKLLHSPVD